MSEIDKMRDALNIKHPFYIRVPTYTDELERRQDAHRQWIEEMLRTLMIGGADPDEA